MQWTDVTRRPEQKVLRQFAGLCLLAGLGLALWRGSRGTMDWRTYALGGVGLGVGLVGLVSPSAIRWVYSGWMAAVFPIGWIISRLVISLMFFGLFTPVALFFRLIGRDALRVRRQRLESLWIPKRQSQRAEDYLRQY